LILLNPQFRRLPVGQFDIGRFVCNVEASANLKPVVPVEQSAPPGHQWVTATFRQYVAFKLAALFRFQRRNEGLELWINAWSLAAGQNFQNCHRFNYRRNAGGVLVKQVP
jgi:hypothetical protein